MIYIGIDPGKQGAIAALDQAGALLSVVPTPLVESKTARDEYALPEIRNLLAVDPAASFVTVEKLGPMPAIKGTAMGGTIANYNRGEAKGWAWMLTALGLPFQLVAPQAWQRDMLLGTVGADTGQRSIIAAQRLFPGVDLRRTPRSRKPCDGLSDALLLAEWGRRRHQGQTVMEPVEP